MKTLFSRCLPDGLAARFALLLVCALVVANLLSLLVLSFERARWGRESRDNGELERIIALVPVLESIQPERRISIATNASTRRSRIEISDHALIAATHSDKRSQLLQQRLSHSLTPREVLVSVSSRQSPGSHSRQSQNRQSNRNRSQQSQSASEIISVSIRLVSDKALPPGERADGATVLESERAAWVNITARAERAPPGMTSRLFGDGVFFVVVGLSLVSVLAVGLWFVRKLTQPLALLAEAAQAAGRGDRTARVPELGAREVRAAASAFNSMQAEIARFDAERTRTLGAVGHDLRTPITSLRIRAEMLDDEFRDPMVRTLEEMTVMANDLVAFARGNSNGEKLQKIDLNQILMRLCEERGAQYEPGGGVMINGRPVALIRAIGNLIDNAIRYGLSARVSLDHCDGKAVISIEDDGPGIPVERMSSIFEPFVRGEESRNTETGGAGLGLSIARSIIRAHGGTIKLNNRKPNGLIACVELAMTE